jgi:hypothetical protein
LKASPTKRATIAQLIAEIPDHVTLSQADLPLSFSSTWS